MKKITLILSILALLVSLSAVEFKLSGDSRTRGALANSRNENDGGYVDGRIRLFLDTQLHQDLGFHIQAQAGDYIWGNGGAGIGTGQTLKIQEAYMDYNLASIDAKFKLGLMEWADRNGLVMDDSFAGVMFSKEFGDNINTEFALMKAYEGGVYSKDDAGMFMANVELGGDMPVGAYAFVGYDRFSKVNNYTLMPYLALDLDAIALDITAFVDIQDANDTDLGFGGAIRAGMDLDILEVGADLLVATEHGLSTLSPYYQNGLYIYGNGDHHDGLNLYWGAPYDGNSDFFMSAVGSVKTALNEKLSLFGHAGYLLDLGFEINAGVEYEIIPDLFGISGYGAFGIHDNDTNNYAIGSTLNIRF